MPTPEKIINKVLCIVSYGKGIKWKKY
jgi:hypothetical protein